MIKRFTAIWMAAVFSLWLTHQAEAEQAAFDANSAAAVCHGALAPGWQVIGHCSEGKPTCIAFAVNAVRAFPIECQRAGVAEAPPPLAADWRAQVRDQGENLCLTGSEPPAGWERLVYIMSEDHRHSTIHAGKACSETKIEGPRKHCIAVYARYDRMLGFVEVDCHTRIAAVTYRSDME